MGNDGLETLLAYDAVRRKPYRRYRRFYGRRRYRRFRKSSRHRGYTTFIIRPDSIDELSKKPFSANQYGLVYRKPKPGFVMDPNTYRIRKMKASDLVPQVGPTLAHTTLVN